MKCYDAIVIGLGGMGSAAVAHLASRGVRVLGLEQFTPVHSRGSSHGQSRVIRQSYFEHPDYVPLLIRAYELWNELQSKVGGELMVLTGGLMIGRPDSQTVLGSQRSAILHGLAHEMLSSDQIRKRFPAFNPTDDLIGLFETNAGFVRPERCIQSYLQSASASQAELHFEEPVIDWNASTSRTTIIVRTSQGSYETESLVLAPGAWAPRLFKLAIPLQVVRQVLFWIEPTSSIDLFSQDRFPIYIWEMDYGFQFYGFPQHGPASDGIKVAVFYNHDPCDPDRLESVVDDKLVQQIRDCLKDRIPGLSGRVVKALPCMYTNTPDHHFVIGRHPEHPRIFIASPCSGHGFKFCSVIGEILADLATQGETRHSIAMFSPQRQF